VGFSDAAGAAGAVGAGPACRLGSNKPASQMLTDTGIDRGCG